jgi:hypothetical protein
LHLWLQSLKAKIIAKYRKFCIIERHGSLRHPYRLLGAFRIQKQENKLAGIKERWNGQIGS